MLEEHKTQAAGTDGILLPAALFGSAQMLPSGKPPMYRFHLAFPEFHLFISKSQESDQYPNTFISLTAKTLWELGLKAALDKVLGKLAFLGGDVQRIIPSRVDPCADFLLDRNIALDFVRQHHVCRSIEWKTCMNGEALETFYMGAKSSPIPLRLYNKYREIINESQKFWMFDIWQIEAVEMIWRVEFQVRREVLKQFGIDTVDDLLNKAGGLWTYLTNQWFSLRLPDNDNPTRRTVHPWWTAVQNADWLLGIPMDGKRTFNKYARALAEFFVARAASNLRLCRARRAIRSVASLPGLRGRHRIPLVAAGLPESI